MALTIDPQLEHEIEERAHARGYRQPADYLADLVRQERQAAADPEQGRPAEPLSRGRAAVERMRGTATSGLTTDQIMEMTRSEV